jgi:DHA1 family inner membrane transport protein
LLPRGATSSAPQPGLTSEFRVLGRQQVWSSLIIMLMLMMGQFVPFTYIAPLLQEVTGLGAAMVPWVLLLIGVGSTFGVFVGGRLADGKLMPAMTTMLGLQAAILAMIYFVSPHPLPMVTALTIWGALNFAIGTAVQTRILGWTADAPNLASSLIPAGFNVGIALAAFVGGLLLTGGYGYRSLPVLGIAAMIVAVGVALSSSFAERRSGLTPPAPVDGMPLSDV